MKIDLVNSVMSNSQPAFGMKVRRSSRLETGKPSTSNSRRRGFIALPKIKGPADMFKVLATSTGLGTFLIATLAGFQQETRAAAQNAPTAIVQKNDAKYPNAWRISLLGMGLALTGAAWPRTPDKRN